MKKSQLIRWADDGFRIRRRVSRHPVQQPLDDAPPAAIADLTPKPHRRRARCVAQHCEIVPMRQNQSQSASAHRHAMAFSGAMSLVHSAD